MFTLKSIHKTFFPGTLNELPLFEQFNLMIEPGDFITVIGSNGSGKSTLLNMIAGDILIDEGKIIYNDQPIHHLPNYKRSRFIARVYQDPNHGVAPHLTVLENLSMAWYKQTKNPFKKGVTRSLIPYFKEQLALCDLGLEHMLDKQTQFLSGGQRQALSLIMAVLHKPDILLLDEHTAALDPKTAEKILSLTDQLVKQHEVTTIMVTHNMQDALTYGNRLIMLNQGDIILDLDEQEKAEFTTNQLIDQFKQLKQVDDRFILV